MRMTLMRMKTTRRIFGPAPVLALALALGLAVPAAAQGQGAHPLRILLPEASDSGVSVRPGPAWVELDLPRGAVFPVDLTAATDGLLSGGDVVETADGRLMLKLTLGRGVLEAVDYRPRAVILRLRDRGAAAPDEQRADRYELGPDDKLVLNVRNHPEMTKVEMVVSREGTVTVPYIGDIPAAGLTPTELAGFIEEALGQSFLKDPQADVAIVEYRSKWVMVNGEVRSPGRVFLTGGTRLKDALADAQGFIETSGEDILISRPTSDDGEIETITIDRKRFEDGQINPVVHPGDIITVQGVEWAFIQGEVRAPTRVRIERDTTLLMAISMAQGLTDWADRKKVRVLDGDGKPPKTYNLKAIQTGKEPDPRLKGGDIIVVERRFF